MNSSDTTDEGYASEPSITRQPCTFPDVLQQSYFIKSEEQSNRGVRDFYLHKIRDRLVLDGTPTDEAAEDAWDVLENNGHISLNAKAETDGQEYEAVNNIEDLKNEYRQLVDKSFHFAALPTEDTKVTIKKESKNATPTDKSQVYLSLDQDTASRFFQYDNCARQLKSALRKKEMTVAHGWGRYTSYEQFLHGTGTFLQSEGPKAREVYIVINGHGNARGISFHASEEPVPFDTVYSDLKRQIIRQTVESKLVPYAVHFIFAMCYAHCGDYTSDDKEDIVQVTTFTGPKREETHAIINLVNGQVTNARHKELNRWAKNACSCSCGRWCEPIVNLVRRFLAFWSKVYELITKKGKVTVTVNQPGDGVPPDNPAESPTEQAPEIIHQVDIGETVKFVLEGANCIKA